MQVTDVVYRGNGFTVSFSNGDTADAKFVTENGSFDIIGLSNAQKQALISYNQSISDTNKLLDARFSNRDIGLGKYGYAVDDILVPITTTQQFGANPMSFGLFRSTPGTTLGSAVKHDGSNGNSSYIEDGGALFDFNADWSTHMWVNIDANQPGLGKGLMQKDGAFTLSPNPSSDTIKVEIDGVGQFTSTTQYIANQKNHIVLTASISGGGPYNVVYTLYINNAESGQLSAAGVTPGDNANDIEYAHRDGAGRYMKGTFDDIRWYSAVLSESDVEALWAGGQGTHDLVESAPSQAALLLHHKLDDFDTSGDPITSDADPVVANYEWRFGDGDGEIVDGLVTESATTGVYSYFAASDRKTEAFFSMQMSHSYIPGSPIEPHVHWVADETPRIGNVIFELEYSIADYGDEFLNTTVLTKTATPRTGHLYSTFGYIDGTGLTRSFILQGRIARRGDLDTYPGVVAMLDIDFHYAKNKIGDNFNSVPPWQGQYRVT